MIKDYSFGVIPVKYLRGKLHFLLIQHNVGHWSFPKGHKENNETDIETAIRELYEETNIQSCEIIKNKSFIEHYQWKKESEMCDKKVKFFIGKIEDSTVKISKKEIQNFEWMKFEDAIKRLTHIETKELLKEIYEYLNQNDYNQIDTDKHKDPMQT